MYSRPSYGEPAKTTSSPPLIPFDDHVAVPEGRVSSSNVVLEMVSTSSLASARTVMSTSSPRSTDVGLIRGVRAKSGRSWSNWVLTSLLEPLMSPLNPVKRAPKVAFQALEESTLVSKLVVYVWVPVVATVAGGIGCPQW